MCEGELTLSALQGSSMVMCTRRRLLGTTDEACREMPVLAASLTMATSLRPWEHNRGWGGGGVVRDE